MSEIKYDRTIKDYKLALSHYSRTYGINYFLLHNVVQCESSFNDEAVGDEGLAYSLAQYHEKTFDRFCKGDYHNGYDQLECMAWMFSQHLESHWSCVKIVLNKETMFDETVEEEAEETTEETAE